MISGDLDVSLPWTGHSEILASRIRRPRVVHLKTAHLSNLELPRSFSAALHAFLPTERTDGRESGMRVRRAVLGDAHVDKALESTASTPEFQDFITRYAWGTIWTRPGLDVRTRRLLVLATTAAMGRWEEFRLHLRTGLARELEWCDIEEVLLQTPFTQGVPAATPGSMSRPRNVRDRRQITAIPSISIRKSSPPSALTTTSVLVGWLLT